jgi:malonyl-CoA/methylmalonyl-CoA synthetase
VARPEQRSVFLAHLREIVARHGDRVAVGDDVERLTYAELWARSQAVADDLGRRGLEGARVGVLARAGAPWVEAFLGTLLAGGTVVALSPLHPPRELRALVDGSRARALLASGDLFDLATEVAGPRAVLRVEALAERAPPPTPSATSATSATLASFGAFAPSDDGVALVLFTSGTTGAPKGALLTHANVLHLARTLGEAWQFRATDVLLHTLPLHHLHGIGVSLLVALAAGAATRFLPRFDAARAWGELASATVLMGVPTQHRLLFDAFDAADAATQARWARHGAGLRLVTSGSAALPTPVGERWRAVTGQYPLERYGMTEVGIVLSNPAEGERRPGTVGLPLAGVEARVVCDTGEDAAEGEPGELWVRAPTVFAGYDDNATATRAAFTDGWFRTGDTVARASDGYVKILGRTSVDILKSGGYKLSALEIEDALREHDAVADVAVVGVPDETWGDLVVAVVVPRAGRPGSLSEEALRAWARERIAPYKVPRRVVFVEELPRNALGKVTKATLAGEVRRVL